MFSNPSDNFKCFPMNKCSEIFEIVWNLSNLAKKHPLVSWLPPVIKRDHVRSQMFTRVCLFLHLKTFEQTWKRLKIEKVGSEVPRVFREPVFSEIYAKFRKIWKTWKNFQPFSSKMLFIENLWTHLKHLRHWNFHIFQMLVNFTAGGRGGGSAPKGETWPQNAVHPHRPSAHKFLKIPASRNCPKTAH